MVGPRPPVSLHPVSQSLTLQEWQGTINSSFHSHLFKVIKLGQNISEETSHKIKDKIRLVILVSSNLRYCAEITGLHRNKYNHEYVKILKDSYPVHYQSYNKTHALGGAGFSRAPYSFVGSRLGAKKNAIGTGTGVVLWQAT